MKRRMLSILLSAIMIVSLLPAAVFAAEEPTGLDNFKKIRTYSDGQFTDVNTTDWFYKNVASVYEFDLMIGRSDTEFAPEENMTVAEAMTIAARMHAIYHTGTAAFTQGLPWYQVYADYCRASGIADPDGYDPDAPATRAQFAEIIANAFPSEAFSAVNRVDDDMIPDVKTTDEFGAAVYMLYRAGVLTGNDDKGTFAPDSSILRMEAAAIITRMVDPSLRESVRLVRETSGGGGGQRRTFTVTFDVQGHGTAPQPVSGLAKGSKITAPAAPTADGYLFKGWYKEADCVNAWDFAADTVTANTTLYAKWKVDNGTFKAVAYDNGDGTYTLKFFYDDVDHSKDSNFYKAYSGTLYTAPTDPAPVPTADSPTVSSQLQDYIISVLPECWSYNEIRESVSSVVIDESVQDYHGLTSTAGMFTFMLSAEGIEGAEYLDMSNVTNMSGMFAGFGAGVSGFNSMPDVSGWDTSKVTDMSGVFFGYGQSSTVFNAVPDVSGWDTAGVTSMSMAFFGYGAGSAVLDAVPDVSEWDTANVADMSSLFYGYGGTALNAVPDVSKWDTSGAIDMSTIFCSYGMYSEVLNCVPDVSKWDTSGVKCMYGVFMAYGGYCKVLNAVPDVSEWNMSNVAYLDMMFREYAYGSEVLTDAPDVSKWNTSNVESIAYVFRRYGNDSKALTGVPDVTNWDTAKVKDMMTAFCRYGEASTVLDFKLDLSGWSVASLKDKDAVADMFDGSAANGKGWSVTIPAKTGDRDNTATAWYLGDGTDPTKYILPGEAGDGRTFTLPPVFKAVAYDNGDDTYTLKFFYDDVDHSSDSKFHKAYSGTLYTAPTDPAPVPDDTIHTVSSPLLAYMISVLPECWSYNEIRASVSSIIIDESVKDYHGLTSTAGMFTLMGYAEKIEGTEYLDMSNVTNMSAMFAGFGGGVSGFNFVPDVSKWDTSNVTDMSGMFFDYALYSTVLNKVPDVSKWNTSKVTNMSCLFGEYAIYSEVLEAVPDVSGWDTSNVEHMSCLFSAYGSQSKKLNSVPDVSKWKTSKVEDMAYLFAGFAQSTETLNAVPDVSGWDTSSVTMMYGIFRAYGYGSKVLNKVPAVTQWKTGNAVLMNDIFRYYGDASTALDFTLDLSGWSVASALNAGYMFSRSAANGTNWSVTIPAKTGDRDNTAAAWYFGDGTDPAKFIAPADGEAFTPASASGA